MQDLFQNKIYNKRLITKLMSGSILLFMDSSESHKYGVYMPVKKKRTCLNVF